MKNLLVYPYSLEVSPIVRFSEMLSNFDTVFPVAEANVWGEVDGKDIAYFDGGYLSGIKVSTDFEKAIKQADAVLFSDEIYDKVKAVQYMSLCKKLGKEIVVSHDACVLLGVPPDDCSVFLTEKFDADVAHDHKLRNISVPVILVTGQGQQCNKFDIQLGLRKKFMEEGYTVSQVGTKEHSALFGIHVIPLFFEAPLWKKVLLYNRFFRDVINREQPDVLIVGVPGGTMPINEWNNELFGETAIAIATSLKPDLTIHSLYRSRLNDSFLVETRNHAKYALSSHIDFFHISNTWLVFEQDNKTINFLTTDSNTVLDELEDISEDLFSVFMPESCNRIYEDVLLQLQSNIEMI